MNDKYILVRLSNQNSIQLYYIDNSYKNITYSYPVCFSVNLENIDSIFTLLSLFSGINMFSTKHKLYLGQEIFKVQVANGFKQGYIQD
uniref:Uncharacterized protein n=1 Tax=Polysiphonia urceolata TaxID=173545 RepID=A0A1Z1MC14_POLUR|nr:hypothetical protein [Polysiphonia stricta]ARW63489.1 hypothetical protein [Polysiphonia stricta]